MGRFARRLRRDTFTLNDKRFSLKTLPKADHRSPSPMEESWTKSLKSTIAHGCNKVDCRLILPFPESADQNVTKSIVLHAVFS